MTQVPLDLGILVDTMPITSERVETARQYLEAPLPINAAQFLPELKWFDEYPNTTIPVFTENYDLLLNVAGTLISAKKNPQRILTQNLRLFRDPLAELKSIKLKVEFREKLKGEIADFLLRNGNLIPLIKDSIPIIESIFPTPKLVAEMFADPESPHGDQLIIYIKSTLSVDETLAKIKKIDKLCGVSVYNKSGKQVLIMEEYV